jgi:hypothetical protein
MLIEEQMRSNTITRRPANLVNLGGRRMKIDDEASNILRTQFEFVLGVQLDVW